MTNLTGQIWQTLSVINVNEHTQKKANLTFLSWTWAYSVLMQHYPNNNYELSERLLADGSVEVNCTLTITEGDQSVSRTMWLPVMDHRNKAIQNPDARQISDAKMRCLVKCLAMFGLGIYIYAGQDIPQAESEAKRETITEDQAILLGEAIVHSGTDMKKVINVYKVSDIRHMTVEQYEQAMHTLERKIAQNAATEAQ